MRLLRQLTLMISLLCFTLPALWAAKANYLRLGKSVTLENAGIKVRLFRDMRSQPLPSVNRFQMRNTVTSEKFKTFSIYELWFQEQAIGFWRNDQGFVLFGNITLAPPENRVQLVTKEFYESWKKSNEVSYKKKQLVKWLSAFTGCQIGEGNVLKRQKNMLVLSYPPVSPSGNPQLVFFPYIVRQKLKGKDLYFSVCYGVFRGPKYDKSVNAIAKSIASISVANYKKAVTDKAKIKGKVNKRKEWSGEYEKDRERVISNIKNLKEWWYNETDNYLIVSNLKTKKEVKFLQERIEQCRDVFEALYPLKRKLDAVSVVKVFNSREGYKGYVGPMYEWTGGIWMTSRNELVVSPVFNASRRKNKEIIGLVLNHEGFHQYLHYAAGGIQSSAWFNEGNAAFFEGIEFKRKGDFKIKTTRRMELMKELALKSRQVIPALIQMGYREFYRERYRQTNYTFAWGLLYYLHKGSLVSDTRKKYYEIPQKYYQALVTYQDPQKATEIAWKGIDLNQFCNDFTSFWQNSRALKKSEKVKLKKVKLSKK